MPTMCVVFQGGVSHWPAIEKWTDEYLMEAIGKDDGYMTVAPKDNIFYFYGGKRDIRPCTVGEFLKVNYIQSVVV